MTLSLRGLSHGFSIWRSPICALVVLALAGCAGPTSSVKGEAPGLKPGMKIEVGKVVTPPGSSFEVDVGTLMRESLNRALTEEDLIWSGDPTETRLKLDLQIVDYQPGNAFKRWLLPGYGSTILQISGQLTDVQTVEIAGRFDHKRGVGIGGAYTIGAWKTIFDNVANDIAMSLANRIFREGFVIGLDAWSSREIRIPTTESPQTYTLVEIRDLRADKTRIGERFAAFDVSMGNIYFFENVNGFLTDTVSDELRAAGHTVQNSGPGRLLTLEILSFWVKTDTTLLYWDVIADIKLNVRVGSATASKQSENREFTCESSERTYVWPGESLVTEVLDTCLTNLMRQLRSDSILKGEG